MKLLSHPQDNSKIARNTIPTYSLFLAPDTVAGGKTVCPNATNGCRAGCLFTAGRAGVLPSIQRTRIAKTAFLLHNPSEFYAQLADEIRAAIRRAGVKPGQRKARIAFRLNGTSDLPHWRRLQSPRWAGENAFDLGQAPRSVVAYDYTAVPRYILHQDGGAIGARDGKRRYFLTFSRKENNWDVCQDFLVRRLANVSVVFRDRIPREYKGFRVIDGDIDDQRFLDPQEGLIVGLKAKGRAKRDRSGFVVDC